MEKRNKDMISPTTITDMKLSLIDKIFPNRTYKGKVFGFDVFEDDSLKENEAYLVDGKKKIRI